MLSCIGRYVRYIRPAILKRNLSIQYISDLHGEYRKEVPRVPVVSKNLALCGDIGNPFFKNYDQHLKWCSYNYENVFLVAGNHEYWNHHRRTNYINIDEHNNQIDYLVSKYPNVNFLNRSSFKLNEKTTILGATLWSDIINRPSKIVGDDLRIYKNNNSITWKGIKKLHYDDLKWLKGAIKENHDKKIVVITHHLPTKKLIVPRYSAPQYIIHHDRFASDLEYLIKDPIKIWLCGHSHSKNTLNLNGVYLGINAFGHRKNYDDKYLKSKVVVVDF